MKRKIAVFASALTIAMLAIAWIILPRGVTPSPYVSDLDSPVRGLSAAEVDDLLRGAGAGYARTAELNGYPGPRHLLDLRNELALSSAQIATIEVVFVAMNAEARAMGGEIVSRERSLSEAFASRRLRSSELSARLEELGQLYAKLRGVHLSAHVLVTPELTPHQIARYDELRGYSGGGAASPHPRRSH